jgi:hypothetical protein
MNLMYDAVTVINIPADATHVAAYVDGYNNVKAMRTRFPKATITTITVTGKTADVLDLEKGAATASDATAWVPAMRKRGRRPIVYCSLSNLGHVVKAFRDAKVPGPFYWVADWTNVPHLVFGSIATQYRSDPGLDTSLVADDFPKPLQSKRKAVPVTITAAQAKSALIQLAAILGLINTYANEGHLPVAARSVIATVSGLVVIVEHYFVKSTAKAVAVATAAPAATPVVVVTAAPLPPA